MANPKKPDTSPRVFQRPKLKNAIPVRDYPLTEKQKAFIQLVLDKNTKVIFLSGPAGSSKSFLGVLSAIQLLNAQKVSEFFYTRPIVESADSGSKLGFLPGDYNDKVAPYEQVLRDKLEELLTKESIFMLEKEERFKTLAVNYLRGASLSSKCGIIDESQNFTFGELVTILTRMGQYSKFIICADPFQSDLPLSKQGGFIKMFEHFRDKEEAEKNGIYCVEFTKEDIVRSDICAYLVEELQNIK